MMIWSLFSNDDQNRGQWSHVDAWEVLDEH